MNLVPKERLIVALDFGSADETLKFVQKMGDSVIFYKVGLELFSAAGPVIVKRLKSLGKLVFLDLKFHDIPNTIAGAATAAVEMGADMFNVHALGGKAMMRATSEATSRTASKLGVRPPTVLAVTVLTSLDRQTLENEIGLSVGEGVGSFVAEKARQAKESGLGGVVASPKEVPAIRTVCGADFHIVTPGVRPNWASSDDQKRVATPSEALAAGADRIVIGRPITRAKDPLDAVQRIFAELH